MHVCAHKRAQACATVLQSILASLCPPPQGRACTVRTMDEDTHEMFTSPASLFELSCSTARDSAAPPQAAASVRAHAHIIAKDCAIQGGEAALHASGTSLQPLNPKLPITGSGQAVLQNTESQASTDMIFIFVCMKGKALVGLTLVAMRVPGILNAC